VRANRPQGVRKGTVAFRGSLPRSLITAFVAVWVGLFIPAIGTGEDGGLSERPNILFILSDNFRWDCMGFMNHPFIKTPGLDRLAEEGIVFENAFNTTSLCSPSRASILTGTYAHTHGVLNNHTPWTGQKPTFLEYLSKAGYDTAFIGKWHMPGKGLPDMPYLDLFVSYTYREGQGSYFNCPLIVNGRPEPSEKAYITEEMTRRAIEFIEQRSSGPEGTRRPFCIYLSHRTAHPPFHAPEGIAGMYAQEKVSLPKGVDSWFSRTNGNVFQGIMMGSYEDQYRKYCEVITAMDRDILVLMDRVDELGLRDNTIIVYAGDNGMMWGEHRLPERGEHSAGPHRAVSLAGPGPGAAQIPDGPECGLCVHLPRPGRRDRSERNGGSKLPAHSGRPRSARTKGMAARILEILSGKFP